RRRLRPIRARPGHLRPRFRWPVRYRKRPPGPLLLHGRPSPPQLAHLSRSLRSRRCFRRPGGNPIRVPLYVVLTRARNTTLLLLVGDGLPALVAPLANLASQPSSPSRTTVSARCASPQRGPATERDAKVLAHSPPSSPLPDGAPAGSAAAKPR